MNKNEFEYNYYFEMFKEHSTIGHIAFKAMVKKKIKTSIDLDKLILDIERYQINKYGNIKGSAEWVENPGMLESQKLLRKEWEKNLRKFGTREERNRRKIANKYKD